MKEAALDDTASFTADAASRTVFTAESLPLPPLPATLAAEDESEPVTSVS